MDQRGSTVSHNHGGSQFKSSVSTVDPTSNRFRRNAFKPTPIELWSVLTRRRSKCLLSLRRAEWRMNYLDFCVLLEEFLKPIELRPDEKRGKFNKLSSLITEWNVSYKDFGILLRELIAHKSAPEILLNAINENDELKEEPPLYITQAGNIKQFANTESYIDGKVTLVTQDAINGDCNGEDDEPDFEPDADDEIVSSWNDMKEFHLSATHNKQYQKRGRKLIDINHLKRIFGQKDNYGDFLEFQKALKDNDIDIAFNQARKLWIIYVNRSGKRVRSVSFTLDMIPLRKEPIATIPSSNNAQHVQPLNDDANINGDRKEDNDDDLNHVQKLNRSSSQPQENKAITSKPNRLNMNANKQTNVMKSTEQSAYTQYEQDYPALPNTNEPQKGRKQRRRNRVNRQNQSNINKDEEKYDIDSIPHKPPKDLIFGPKYNDNNLKGNFYLSEIMQWRIAATANEQFFTHHINKKDLGLLLYYFKGTSAMQINDGQIKVVYGRDDKARIIINPDLHFRDGQDMFLVAEQQQKQDREEYGVQWTIVDIMTAEELNDIGIDHEDLPQSSRNRNWFNRALSYSPQNMTKDEIIDMLKRTHFGSKRFRAKGNNDNLMEISEIELKKCCKEALWHKRLLPLPVVVIKGHQHWIEWKQIVGVYDKPMFGNTGWIAISLRYYEQNQRWNVEKIDDDGGIVYYKHRLVALAEDDEFSYTYNQLQDWLGTSLHIF